MARYAYNVVIVASLLLFASAAWAEQYFIYSPKSVQKEEAKQTKDGILVRSVPVQNGDSLYSISQKITGRGMYYPQILLFNDIKNPSDIRPGDNIRVPVPKDSPVAEDKGVVVPKGKSAKESVKEPTVAEVKKASADKGKPAKHHAKAPVRHKAKVSHVAAATTREPSEGQSGSGQLAELAISEGKPLPNTGKKKRVAKQSEPIINTRKPLRGENSWKEKPLGMKRQPMTEEEVRPSAATRQAELRQAGRIPMSPDEIRPVLSATSFQDVETAYQYRASKPSPQPIFSPPPVESQPLSAAESSDSQRLFEQAIKAYRQEDCIKALDLFGNFLITYPDLPQASDATLYKAECLMKMSKQ